MINTPTIKAAKFWPGSLGRHATHAVVFARLIVGKKDFGPLPFMVPIRSRVNHKPFDGIKVGDIGTKMGYNTVDNGYLEFDHYRIPRGALLQRFVSLTNKGEFELLGDPRAIYQIMVMSRMTINFGAAFALLRSCTMATRYAVCRRQFANYKDSKAERRLIDY